MGICLVVVSESYRATECCGRVDVMTFKVWRCAAHVKLTEPTSALPAQLNENIYPISLFRLFYTSFESYAKVHTSGIHTPLTEKS